MERTISNPSTLLPEEVDFLAEYPELSDVLVAEALDDPYGRPAYGEAFVDDLAFDAEEALH